MARGLPTSDDANDPKRIVARGYDGAAERYVAWSAGDRARERYTGYLLEALPPGARVLDLGCGAGVPTARRLSERYEVTGVDISGRQIELARRNAPAARFIRADMAALDFPPGSFDAVAAFYSIVHVPRGEHAGLLRRISCWLRPGGLLVASMGHGDWEGGVEEDWLGGPMYFSHHDAETNKGIVEAAGLRIVQAREETQEEDGNPVTFFWVVAHKDG